MGSLTDEQAIGLLSLIFLFLAIVGLATILTFISILADHIWWYFKYKSIKKNKK